MAESCPFATLLISHRFTGLASLPVNCCFLLPIKHLAGCWLCRKMYAVRLRRPDGGIAQKKEFPDLREALRHMDALVCAFPDLVSEVRGMTGVLFRYEPQAREAAEPIAAS